MGLFLIGITISGLLLLHAAWVIFPSYAPYFKLAVSLFLGWFAAAATLSFHLPGKALRLPLGRGVVFWAMGLYAFLSFGMSLLRHWTFKSNALDLGMMDQVVWNTLYGRPFYTSLKGMNFLGEHFSPIMAVFSPFYLIFSHVSLLLLAQSLSISASGLILFHIARAVLRQEQGATALVLAYFLSPFLLNAQLFDFQPDKLEPPFLLLAFLGLYRGSLGLYGGSLALLMLIKEDGGLWAMALGLYALLATPHKKMGWTSLGIGTLYLGLITQWLIPAFGPEGGRYIFWERYNYLGQSPQEAVVRVITHPGDVLSVLLVPNRLEGLAGTLGPLGFLPLLGGWAFLTALPSLLINVLSGYPGQYRFVEHHAVTVYPFLLIAATFGLRRVITFSHLPLPGWRAISPEKRVHTIAFFLVVTNVAAHYFFGPIYGERALWRENPWGEHQRLGHQLLTLIPKDAAVSAQSPLVPHLAQREKIYLFPTIKDAEYIFLDTRAEPYPLRRGTETELFKPSGPDSTAIGGAVTPRSYEQEVKKLLARTDFKLIAEEDGYLLLQRR